MPSFQFKASSDKDSVRHRSSKKKEGFSPSFVFGVVRQHFIDFIEKRPDDFSESYCFVVYVHSFIHSWNLLRFQKERWGMTPKIPMIVFYAHRPGCILSLSSCVWYLSALSSRHVVAPEPCGLSVALHPGLRSYPMTRIMSRIRLRSPLVSPYGFSSAIVLQSSIRSFRAVFSSSLSGVSIWR